MNEATQDTAPEANGSDAERDYDCVRRGPEVDVMLCNLCGGGRGQPFTVFGCELYGMCSDHKKHRNIRSCAGCEDRSTPTPDARHLKRNAAETKMEEVQ